MVVPDKFHRFGIGYILVQLRLKSSSMLLHCVVIIFVLIQLRLKSSSMLLHYVGIIFVLIQLRLKSSSMLIAPILMGRNYLSDSKI
jgi:uncharacterized membrane protein